MNNGGQVCPKPTLGFSRPNFAGFELQIFTNKTSWRYGEWSERSITIARIGYLNHAPQWRAGDWRQN